MSYTGKVRDRFYRKVRICMHGKSCDICCWHWHGARLKDGYGVFKMRKGSGKWSNFLAHRVAWELANCTLIPEGKVCIHICDVKPCCQPSHLRIGSQRENMQDAIHKGRFVNGERSPNAKLTGIQVHQILMMEGLSSQQVLAKQFGVSTRAIRGIFRGDSWSYLREGKPNRIRQTQGENTQKKNLRPRLSPCEVEEILELEGKVSQSHLAAKFHVSKMTISNIYRGRTYNRYRN